ncbi:hypothetical protein Q0Z83_086390 [Actinoplanes sichuanensis]|uniref:Uncharacterized protein n=1 Tax=Actinoplanes sichuanensis TaxID=512349 RepID=A0ABW4AKU5_9ACTN|nr:hypothetical protein [Actinoplanes sichuanensis]BEL10448.1 hypothetical protein Q0Z83_086390 [Actinoplanes sichuanensis]
MSVYDPGQLLAGYRSMSMLAGLVERGGRPAAVSPTVPLWAGEKQYGWFPVDVVGGDRRLAVVTNRRLLLGDESFALRTVTGLRPRPDEWALALDVRGHGTMEVIGPWVPWLGVVLCAEIYGAAWPPGYARMIPAPRRAKRLVTIQ